MFAGLARRLTDAIVESLVRRMMQDPYTENIFSMVPVIQKLGLRQIVEAGMRAETGKPISRPLGSPVTLSPWEKVLLNPVALTRLPTPGDVTITTDTVIGPRAKRPLRLRIPTMITGMSYGSALSLQAKVALAMGSSLAGTATNSGESPLVPEERQAADLFIGQYNRGGWMNEPDSLRQLDGIEIQLGQGAQASAPMKTSHKQISDYMRKLHKLKPGEDSVIHSRLKDVNSADDFKRLVGHLRGTYGVPVGYKFAATHYLEDELDIALDADIDYVVIDGAEAGTHGGPPVLQDDVGLPTLYAVARAGRHLERRGRTGDVSIIAAGGLTTPGHFIKAMALGADAVYIGSIALIALMQAQLTKPVPFEPAPQLVLNLGKFKEDLDIEAAAQHLAKFLRACTKEMELVAYALGKTSLADFDRSDLVTVDWELARALAIDHAGHAPAEQRQWREGREGRDVPDWVRPVPVRDVVRDEWEQRPH